MADDPIWRYVDPGDDEARFYVRDLPAGVIASLHSGASPIHFTREALAGLVRAAAPLAGLTVDESAERFAVDMRFQALRAAVDMSAQRIDFRVANAEEAERLDIPGQVLADTVRYHRWLTDGEVPA